jgi:trigger factor
MPLLQSKSLAHGVLTLTISVEPPELTPHLERASADLQRARPLPGFRPGKAPVERVRQVFGDMALLDAALKYAVPAAYAAVVVKERLLTVGEPQVTVTKLTPDQPVEFTATVAALPAVTLGRYRDVREPRRPITVTDEEVAALLNELREMRAVQKPSDAPATPSDRVVLDLTMAQRGVIIEGGEARSHAIDLGKPYVIPGFTEALVGLKPNDTKQFSLPFPETHPALRGQTVDVAVTVRGVYRLERPPLDDAFAAAVGKFATLEELRGQLRKNLTSMKETDEEVRLERAIIDTLIAESTFGDIPLILLDAERARVMGRLQEQVDRDGGTWDDYLAHLKKTAAELARELEPEVVKRVKAALLVRAIAEAEGIEVPAGEVAVEQQAEAARCRDDAETLATIESLEYARHVKHVLLTRKVMDRLKEMATQGKS